MTGARRWTSLDKGVFADDHADADRGSRASY